MANRSFNKNVQSPHACPVIMCVTVPIDGSSAVGTQAPVGSLSYVTVTKPAGTGLYRLTFADTFTAVLYADAQLLKAAGTLDADILEVAETAGSSPLVVDFQVKKTSDGTALDPVSLTIKFLVIAANSQVTP